MKHVPVLVRNILKTVARVLLIVRSNLHVTRLSTQVDQHEPLVPRQAGALLQNIVLRQPDPKWSGANPLLSGMARIMQKQTNWLVCIFCNARSVRLGVGGGPSGPVVKGLLSDLLTLQQRAKKARGLTHADHS